MKNAKSASSLFLQKEKFLAFSTHATMFFAWNVLKVGEQLKTQNSIKSTAELVQSVGKDLSE